MMPIHPVLLVGKWPMDVLLLCRSSCGDFIGCLQEYQASKDRQLSPATLMRLQTTYKRSIHTSKDPFKKAVYCVVGRCSVQDNHREVVVKTEDYMWLKVTIVGFSFYASSYIHDVPHLLGLKPHAKI